MSILVVASDVLNTLTMKRSGKVAPLGDSEEGLFGPVKRQAFLFAHRNRWRYLELHRVSHVECLAFTSPIMTALVWASLCSLSRTSVSSSAVARGLICTTETIMFDTFTVMVCIVLVEYFYLTTYRNRGFLITPTPACTL